MNNKEHLPPFFRAIGTGIILYASCLAFWAARDARIAADGVARSFLVPLIPTPTMGMNEDQKRVQEIHNSLERVSQRVEELAYHQSKRDIVEIVSSSPKLSLLTILGSALITLSFFVEWANKRPKRAPAS